MERQKVILYYAGSEEGKAAQEMCRRARQQKELAVSRDAESFDGEAESCDHVIILPNVSAWRRERIEAAYGDKVEYFDHGSVEQKPAGDTGAGDTGEQKPADNGKAAVHRGAGKWYVMRGDDIISGPHDRDEAKRLAAQ